MAAYVPVHPQAIVFVVDRLDTSRLGVVREEFRAMVEHKDVRTKGHPILVLLNKSDCRPKAGAALDAAAACGCVCHGSRQTKCATC